MNGSNCWRFLLGQPFLCTRNVAPTSEPAAFIILSDPETPCHLLLPNQRSFWLPATVATSYIPLAVGKGWAEMMQASTVPQGELRCLLVIPAMPSPPTASFSCCEHLCWRDISKIIHFLLLLISAAPISIPCRCNSVQAFLTTFCSSQCSLPPYRQGVELGKPLFSAFNEAGLVSVGFSCHKSEAVGGGTRSVAAQVSSCKASWFLGEHQRVHPPRSK